MNKFQEQSNYHSVNMRNLEIDLYDNIQFLSSYIDSTNKNIYSLGSHTRDTDVLPFLASINYDSMTVNWA